MIEYILKNYYEYKFSKENSSNYISTTIIYVIILVLFPVSMHYNTNIIYVISFPTICVGYFLVILFILNAMYIDEKNNGILLEYHFLSETAKHLLIIIRLFIIWVYISITMFFGIFIAFILFNLEYYTFFTVITTLILVTPFLLFIGAVSASLLIGTKERTFLIPLLTLPLYIPILMLAISTLQTIVENGVLSSSYYILIIFFVLLTIVIPKIVIYALKIWSE